MPEIAYLFLWREDSFYVVVTGILRPAFGHGFYVSTQKKQKSLQIARHEYIRTRSEFHRLPRPRFGRRHDD